MTGVPVEFVDVGIRLHLVILGWVAFALLVITALLVVALVRSKREDTMNLEFSTGTAAVLTAALVIIWAICLVPFDARYHHLYEVKGNVTSVSNVLSEASGDLTRTPVIELDTVDRPIAMSDPRAVSLEGKDVVLTCEIGWNYRAADTYSCRIHTIGDQS